MRKKTALVLALAIFLIVSSMYVFRELRFIGEITGSEWNNLTIGETEYNVNYGLDFTIADKGMFLGKAKYNTLTVRLYSVNGDEEGKYIYAFWDWEGFFYVRKD